MRLSTWLRHKRFPYEPLITIETSKSRLLSNLKEFNLYAPEGFIAPILKANAYGHGLLNIAKTLEQCTDKITFLGVDSYFEVVALRSRGIKTPLLIIGYTRPETMQKSRLRNVSFTVTNMDTLKSLEKLGRNIKIHLKIDTGMHRQGIRPEEIIAAVEIIKNNPKIILDGIYTHFCDADNHDERYTRAQINIWNKCVDEIKPKFPDIKYIHAASTDGAIFSKDIRANMIRLGIGLYGISENNKLNSVISLLPVLKMKTILTGVKKLNRDETTGYGNTFKATKNMTVATVPVGYSEGLDRRLSNNGTVQVGVHKIPCPIIGRVSMNMITIDVSSVENPIVGTEVTVISDNASDPNSIQSIAKNCKTNTHEIVVKIPAHLKRVMTQ
ncbi:MAG: alanine racemase [bacterium]|nr:alanine racemase [bacterium]